MNKITLFIVLVCGLMLKLECKDRELRSLFNVMEIEDKCGQMTMITLVIEFIYLNKFISP